jgi:hypothetical protein
LICVNKPFDQSFTIKSVNTTQKGKQMSDILFHTFTGQMSLLCIGFAIAMVVYLWIYFIRKSNEASKN